MKLLLVATALALLLSAAPAAADRYLCQPNPAGSLCIVVIDSGGWVYTEACQGGAAANACFGGGHWDYAPTPYVGNGFGGYASTNGVLVAFVAGQEDYFGTFDVYGGVGGETPAGSGSVVGRVGTQGGSPFADAWVCGGTLLTGGTCLLV